MRKRLICILNELLIASDLVIIFLMPKIGNKVCGNLIKTYGCKDNQKIIPLSPQFNFY